MPTLHWQMRLLYDRRCPALPASAWAQFSQVARVETADGPVCLGCLGCLDYRGGSPADGRTLRARIHGGGDRAWCHAAPLCRFLLCSSTLAPLPLSSPLPPLQRRSEHPNSSFIKAADHSPLPHHPLARLLPACLQGAAGASRPPLADAPVDECQKQPAAVQDSGKFTHHFRGI